MMGLVQRIIGLRRFGHNFQDRIELTSYGKIRVSAYPQLRLTRNRPIYLAKAIF